jgi:hypothetical protein
MTPGSRTELLRRQGLIESGFAVLTAVMLFFGTGSALTPLVGLIAIWMALRGRRMLEEAAPLTDAERRELDRMKAESRHVREMLALLERAGQQPVRYDLGRCRRLARLESLIDGQA